MLKHQSRNDPWLSMLCTEDSGADTFTMNSSRAGPSLAWIPHPAYSMLNPETGRSVSMGPGFSLWILAGLHTAPILIFVSSTVITRNLTKGGVPIQ